MKPKTKCKTGLVEVGKLTFEVKILEHRPSYGRENRYLVTPAKGEGQSVITINEFKK